MSTASFGCWCACGTTASESFIIVTLRSDYLGQCANFEGLAEGINRTQFLTPVLTQAELSQAIARPAEDYNGEVEPELVEQIIRDMRTGTAYHSDSLPLMQHALLWMWSKAWQGTGAAAPPRPPFEGNDPPTRLTLQAYQDNGGIEGILDRHAEDVLRRGGRRIGPPKDCGKSLSQVVGTRCRRKVSPLADLGREALQHRGLRARRACSR